MSERHDRDVARPLQPQATQIITNPMPPDQNSVGEFPQSGRFSSSRWAAILGCNKRTVEKYVEIHKVRYRKPGDQMFIEAADFWAALPVIQPKYKPKPKKK